jgi:nucleotide-binding universal stress UspA family protein
MRILNNQGNSRCGASTCSGGFFKRRCLYMEFKDILVHIDNSQQCATRLDLALRLARQHKAHLTGLYAIIHRHYAPHSGAQDHRVMQAQELFQARAAEAGIAAEFSCADWGVTGDSTVEILNFHAHQKDLVIVGQSVHDRLQEHGPADLPERVVLGSGRPVLVVPYAGTFDSVGERILVAWKAGRASARAVHDAMPFLSTAKEVILVTVTSPGDQQLPDAGQDEQIRIHLERHKIRVREERLEAGDVPVDNVLMNFAWEQGCDLLVMGVYAVSQRGSLTVGPVTKGFFEHTTLPILMSH